MPKSFGTYTQTDRNSQILAQLKLRKGSFQEVDKGEEGKKKVLGMISRKILSIKSRSNEGGIGKRKAKTRCVGGNTEKNGIEMQKRIGRKANSKKKERVSQQYKQIEISFPFFSQSFPEWEKPQIP